MTNLLSKQESQKTNIQERINGGLEVQSVEVANSSSYYCMICYEEYTSKDIEQARRFCELDSFNISAKSKEGDIESQSSRPKTPKCFKLQECDHFFCLECIRDTFHSMIEEQQRHSELRCPQHGCQARPTEQEVKIICSEAVYLKYKRFCDNTRVMNDRERLQFCIDPKCETVIDRREFSRKKCLECPTCSKKICKSCNFEYHPGKKCPRDQQSMRNWLGDKSKALVQNCPKCGTLIEKNEGCSHMACVICKFSYCWVCGMGTRSVLHCLFFELICQMWNSAINEHSRNKLRLRQTLCSNYIYLRLLLTLLFGPIFCYVGYAIIFVLTFLFVPGIIVWCKKYEFQWLNGFGCCIFLLFVGFYIPMVVMTLVAGIFAGMLGALALCCYYIVILAFFIRLCTRTCCTCRKIASAKNKETKLISAAVSSAVQVRHHNNINARNGIQSSMAAPVPVPESVVLAPAPQAVIPRPAPVPAPSSLRQSRQQTPLDQGQPQQSPQDLQQSFDQSLNFDATQDRILYRSFKENSAKNHVPTAHFTNIHMEESALVEVKQPQDEMSTSPKSRKGQPEHSNYLFEDQKGRNSFTQVNEQISEAKSNQANAMPSGDQIAKTNGQRAPIAAPETEKVNLAVTMSR